MKAERYEELHRVNVIESDIYLGQKLDAIEYFKTEQEARKWCQKFNKDNCTQTQGVPDWYVVAEYVGCQLVPVFKG